MLTVTKTDPWAPSLVIDDWKQSRRKSKHSHYYDYYSSWEASSLLDEGNVEDKMKTSRYFTELISCCSGLLFFATENNPIAQQGTSTECYIFSRWKVKFIHKRNANSASFKSYVCLRAGRKINPGIWLDHFFSVWCHQCLALLLLQSLFPQSWLGTMFGGKPNIAAEFSVRAHFQLMCQFGEESHVWNTEQVQITVVRQR